MASGLFNVGLRGMEPWTFSHGHTDNETLHGVPKAADIPEAAEKDAELEGEDGATHEVAHDADAAAHQVVPEAAEEVVEAGEDALQVHQHALLQLILLLALERDTKSAKPI